MANVAKFNCGASGPSECYAQKTIAHAGANGWQILVTFGTDSATLTALDAAFQNPGIFQDDKLVGAGSNDGITGTDDFPGWSFQTVFSFNGEYAIGQLVANAWINTEMDWVSGGGNIWTVTPKIAGVGYRADGPTNFGVGTTASMILKVGGSNAFSGVAHEIYYVKSVTVKDGAGVVLFSDDFSSGDFSHWDSTTGAASIVADPFSPAPVVTSYSSSFGAIGSSLTIHGSNFTGATSVHFTSGVSAVFSFVDDNTIIATVPVGTTDGPITVTSPGGTGTGPSFFVSELPPPSGRFFVGYPYRFVVTDLNISTETWAQGLWRNRKITYAVGAGETIEADINPDDIRVNLVTPDGYPRLAQSNRIIYAFRRDGIPPPGGPAGPWQPVAAGIVMAPQDEGDVDTPLTHVTAYSPRTLLNARPVYDSAGSLPEPQVNLFDTADQVALQVFLHGMMRDGGCFIDAGPLWGGTADWAGTIETCPEVNYVASKGSMIGQVWDDLENGGLCNFVLTPIYDPFRTSVIASQVCHFTHDLSILKLSGSEKPNAVFGWDMFNHSIAHISRMHDATPGQFFNVVQYYDGSGPASIPIPAAGPIENAPSIADFGRYWSTQLFPQQVGSDPLATQTLFLANQAIVMAKQGKRTVSLDLIPERAPVWRRDWDLGDRINVHASNRLRATIDGFQRVVGINLSISDEGPYETINLMVTPDWAVPEEF